MKTFGFKVNNDAFEKNSWYSRNALVKSIKQNELVAETGKSLSTIKRIMESLQEKEYICRVNGKRYGKWKILREQFSRRHFFMPCIWVFIIPLTMLMGYY